MTYQHRPGSVRAVIYNEDDLYDFAKAGGSVAALLEEEVGKGNRFIIMRQPTGGRHSMVLMLEKPEDISRWEEHRKKLRNWREKVLEN